MDDLFTSNSTNFSYVDKEVIFSSLVALGPPVQTFLIILYSLTALVALGGNATVIIVLLLGKRSSRELRIFLINLAVSDITMALFSIPFTYTDFMLGRWIFHPAFCPIVQFMQHCSVIVSVYTLTAIGVDRYYAIMYPLNSRWTKSRGSVIVAVIWCAAVGLSSVQLVHGVAQKIELQNGEYFYDCNEDWSEFDGKVYTFAVFTVTFLLPMVILTFVYSSIGWKMWRHTSPGNADASRDQQQFLAKMKVVKMMATVVLLFALSWLPIHIFMLLIYFDPELIIPVTDEEYVVYVASFFCCHWLSMANSFMNPIIYCFMSENFRVGNSTSSSHIDLKQLMFCCFSMPRRHGRRGLKCPAASTHSSFRTTTLVISTCSVRVSGHNNAYPLKNLRSNAMDDGFITPEE